MLAHSQAILAWCQKCHRHIPLTNLRPWPDGVLVVGECPECHGKLASGRPIGWGFEGSGREQPR